MSIRDVLLASLLGGAEVAVPVQPLVEVAEVQDGDESTLAALARDTRRLLAARGIAATVDARVKSEASVLAKMRRKGVDRDGIFDRLALRVRVATEAEAYAVRDLLEARHEVIAGERDDYVANPKPNGYRSLHTAVHTRFGDVAEFQVRTHEMHADAEYGGASHAGYKLATA